MYMRSLFAVCKIPFYTTGQRGGRNRRDIRYLIEMTASSTTRMPLSLSFKLFVRQDTWYCSREEC